MCLLPLPPAPAIDWAAAAASLTFYLDPGLLLATVYGGIPEATDILLWVHGKGEVECITAAGHPVLLVYTPYASPPVEYAELVPHLPSRDPLLAHMGLALQAAIAAEGVAGRLYAEALADALAVHFLRRYTACRHAVRDGTGGLTPAMLQRTLAYIQAHLEDRLPLAVLAAAVQLSPNHFARLFNLSSG